MELWIAMVLSCFIQIQWWIWWIKHRSPVSDFFFCAGQEPFIGKSHGFNLQMFPSTKSVNREHRQPLIKSWLEFSRIQSSALQFSKQKLSVAVSIVILSFSWIALAWHQGHWNRASDGDVGNLRFTSFFAGLQVATYQHSTHQAPFRSGSINHRIPWLVWSIVGVRDLQTWDMDMARNKPLWYVPVVQ